jgi:Ca2+-binding EF-hand superfamily protein
MAERGAKAFDKLDTNKDGQVSRQEFDAGRQAREQRQALRKPGKPLGGNVYMHRKGGMGFAARMFDMADANKDGRVSLPEAQQVALQHFDRADLNHDGTLTPEERRQSREQMRAQRRG